MENQSETIVTTNTVKIKNLLDALNITTVIENGVEETLSSEAVKAACKDMDGLRQYMQAKCMELTMMYVGKFAEIYTEEEIDALVAFHHSPAGKSITQKSLALSRLMSDMNTIQSQQIEQAVARFM